MPIELITKKNNIELVVPAGKGVAEAYEKGFNDGKALNTEFDIYLRNGSFASLNMFKTKEVIINLPNWSETGSFTNFLNINIEEYKNTTVEHITINATHFLPKSMQQMFYCSKQETRDNTLKHITLNIDTKNSTQFSYMFGGLIALEVIDGKPLDLTMSNSSAYMFNFCNALREVRFEPNTISKHLSIDISPNLSAETVASVVEGLKDLTGQTTQNVTFKKAVEDKITDAQKEAIAAKNWTLILKA